MYDHTRLTTPGQLKDEADKKPGAACTTHQASHSAQAWQRGLRGLFMVACLAGVSACSSNYMIKATDGTVYHTQGAPVLQNGEYKFTDAQGQQQEVFLSKVSKVEKL